jgi:hypothetical protein
METDRRTGTRLRAADLGKKTPGSMSRSPRAGVELGENGSVIPQAEGEAALARVYLFVY